MTIYQLTDERTELITLVEAAQQGDREAFGELCQRFERHVLAIALRRLGDYGEAQELCQDVFIQAMNKIGQLREPAAFPGWLRSITHRLAINRIIRWNNELAIEQEALDAACAVEESPLENVLTEERDRGLQAGLARLGQVDRETLVAFYVDGRSLNEMSTDFAAPVGTIKRRLHVARKRLAKEVEELVAV